MMNGRKKNKFENGEIVDAPLAEQDGGVTFAPAVAGKSVFDTPPSCCACHPAVRDYRADMESAPTGKSFVVDREWDG